MSTVQQGDLFGSPAPDLPEGFRYAENVMPVSMQHELMTILPGLPFKNFEFHGFEGKRRTVSYGWKYDFESESLRPTDDLPDFLLPVRDLAARFAGIDPVDLRQALVIEYGPGAPIGWHKDKAVFGRVVGISLLSACTLRLRRKVGSRWERASLRLEPGSAYLLSGPARTEWEHSIPPVEALRYSLTFRELRAPPA
jgi:alkylated DNA repair dioxygenase AlkB